MKILNLTLKKIWFDKVLSGEKKEEYREIKEYWNKRLGPTIKYDTIRFRNGYAKNAPEILIELKTIRTGLGKISLGAPVGKSCHILFLGNILSTKNIT